MMEVVNEPVGESGIIESTVEPGKTTALNKDNTDDNGKIVNMLNRVADSDAHFKHQQRDEPDLTFNEKYLIAKQILEKNPKMFLSRFEKYLVVDDIACFSDVKGDYEVKFYLKKISQNCDKYLSNVLKKNRRYKAMQEMDQDGGDGYFGDEQMKFRDPLLFHQLIGQFETNDEAAAKVDKTDMRFSTILMSHLRHVQMNDVYAVQKDVEESQMEESEDEDEEEDEEKEVEPESETPKVSPAEREMLRAEFVNIMHQRFLDGKDADFDYSSVDQNQDYDSLDLLNNDAEDKYFEDDDDTDCDNIQQMEDT